MDWNELVYTKFKGFIKPNWVVVDVGGHHGDYANFFYNQLGQLGSLYIFELERDNFKKIKNRFLGMPNVFLELGAVCDIEGGEIEYYKGDTTYQHNIIGCDTNYKKNESAGLIRPIMLDFYFSKLPHIDFMKMDIEGAELKALHGMTETIKKIDYLLIECHFNEAWPEIRSILLEYFNCTELSSGDVITPESKRPYQCFCISKRLTV